MTIKEKISALRKIMEREGLDAYIISGTDPHNSEYLPEAWQQRKWISGFTGSFGTVVVTKEQAGLWTDTRYFVQAEQELTGTEIKLHKLRIPGAVDYPEWLAVCLQPGSCVGIDGFCMTTRDVLHLKTYLNAQQIEVKEKTDLLGEIWLDRPALPAAPAFLLDDTYTGKPAAEKIDCLRNFLKENQADYVLLSSLDEIAWLFNIRGADIEYNPVVISYAIIGRENAWLFVKPAKLPEDVIRYLNRNHVEIRDYHHLFLFLEELEKQKHFIADTDTLNFYTYTKLIARFTVSIKSSPVILQKAIKNPIEMEGFRKASVVDGVAMTRFLYWLEKTVCIRPLSETEAARKLTELRAESPDYISDSFEVISAYGKNAALPHYSAREDRETLLENKGLYLVDSGGQYWYGTTDITRTVPLGSLSDLEKEDYTLVLKGMIALARCVFPKGTTGANMDIVARQPLWDKLRNFGHGTGHGIGHVLCVHEGPQDIRQAWRAQPILPGMVTSDEPGIYREGSHGIRHENLLICREIAQNEFGEWCGFETITLCYFDTSALCVELLSREETEWLNAYHQSVYDKLSPFLSGPEQAWLKQKTASI